MRALKNTTLKPYNFKIKIFSIAPENSIKTKLVCPDCHQPIKRPAYCENHGFIKPINMTEDGIILNKEELQKIKGKMDHFEVVGSIHLSQIPLYILQKSYFVKCDHIKFVRLMLELRKTQRALIVKGTLKQGIKHFIMYCKGRIVYLQEIIEPERLVIDESFSIENEQLAKSNVVDLLPKPIKIVNLKSDNIKHRFYLINKELIKKQGADTHA